MKLQKQKIIHVIEQDATLSSQYFSYNSSKCCVIGGLLIAAGISKELKIRIRNSCNGASISSAGTYQPIMEAAELIKQTYGLTTEQQRNLQLINDRYTTTKERRAALIEQVEKWPANPKPLDK